jgi:hypothetical protein
MNLLLPPQPPEVEKGKSPEIGRAAAGGGQEVPRGERSGRAMISSPTASLVAAVAPVATAVPSVATAAAVAGEERSDGVLVSFRSALGMLSTGLGSSF